MSTQSVADFGALLRRHRRAAGLTQEELAERARLSVDAISALERGVNRAPQKGTIELLAEALRLSPEERARLEAAARGRPPPVQAAPRETPLHLVQVDEAQAEQAQALDLPLHLVQADEPEEPARLTVGEKLETTQAERPSPPETAPPEAPAALPARRQRKLLALGLVGLLLVVLVAGGSGVGYWLKLGPFGKGAASAMPTPAYVYAQPTHRGGTITFSQQIVPLGTNPWFQEKVDSDQVFALWGNPYTISPTATFLPDELTEIPTLANGGISQDGLTITMRLRPDLKWSDGQPLTADDFAYWLEVDLDPAIGLFNFGYNQIASHQVRDAQTLVLRFQQLSVFALLYLPLAAPRHVWGSIPDQELSNRDEVNLYPTVTSGPFKLESYVAGQSMTMVPNPYYRSTTLHRSVLDKLVISSYPDADSELAAFEAGQTDGGDSFRLADLPKLGGVQGVHITPTIASEHLEFNLSRLPVLQDEQVRQAIAEAIDRCTLIHTVFQVSCATLRVDTILPAPAPAYDPTIKTFGYDLGQARQDMQIAGWDCSSSVCTRGGQPFPTLTLVTTSGNMLRKKVTELIQQNLKDLGIPVILKYYSGQEMFLNDYNQGGILATGQYDLSLFANFFGLDDDENFSGFASSQIPSASNPGGGNWERVKDPNIDSDLEQGRMTLNVEKRTQLYKDLQRLLVKDVYIVPLYLRPNIALVNPKIGNYQDNPLGPGNLFGSLWNIGDWFLTQ